MKRILLTLIIFYSTILNGSNKYEIKLYEKVLPAIFSVKPIKVFVDNDMKELLKNSKKFKITDNCDNATVLLIGKSFKNVENNRCKNKPIFYTNYRNYKKDKNGFGVFYWRKGRPQIKFKSSSLNYFNIKLPQGLQRYAE